MDIRNGGSRVALPLVAILLAGCQGAPPQALENNGAGVGAIVRQDAGTNQQGEACHFQPSTSGYGRQYSAAFDLYCGTWEQPSGHIFQARDPVAADGLIAAATGSAWRSSLGQRFDCAQPTATSLLANAPAALMQCTQHVGGWPHVALVANAGSASYYLDGVPSAVPALATAVARLSGLKAPGQGEASNAVLISSSISGSGLKSSDLQEYYNLKLLGDEANDQGDFATAEQDYHEARVKQESILGPQNPAIAGLLMNEALQISNQGRYGEADQLFARAATLIGRSPGEACRGGGSIGLAADPVATATLDLYRAESAANQGDSAKADQLAQCAETEFLSVGSLGSWAKQTASRGTSKTASVGDFAFHNAGGSMDKASGGQGSVATLADTLFLTSEERSALSGLETTWWFEAYRAYQAKNFGVAVALGEQTQHLRDATGFNPPGIIPRANEIVGLSAAASGDLIHADGFLRAASNEFERSRASESRAAQTWFLRARAEAARGQNALALRDYGTGVKLLVQTRTKLPAHYIDSYLDLLQRELTANPSAAPVLSKDMFVAFQLVQSGLTERIQAQTVARLAAGGGKVGDVLRAMQDDGLQLDRLKAQREKLLASPDTVDKAALASVDGQIAKVRDRYKQAETSAMAAFPAYGQLVDQVVSADSARNLLKSGEGLLTFHVGSSGSLAVLVTEKGVRAYRIPLGSVALTAKITELRKTIEPDETLAEFKLPVYDVAGAYDLYRDLLGPVSKDLGTLNSLVVVPSGGLNALPLEVLVTQKTAPVANGNYAQVPFLLAKLAVSYMPSPQNLYVLRKNAKPSAARNAYIGFGDFVGGTPAQLSASFSGSGCQADLAGLEQLPALPGTRKEVEYVGSKIFNAPAEDIVLGEDFTKARLEGSNLADFRVVHLATHALLPTDLRCQPEPTIVVSVPRGAVDANAGFLKLSDITQSIKLDADLVILSACNTGSNGKNTGDSLSALSRGFFYAGSRGLLVTHWELSDVAGPLLTALTLQANLKSADSAEALQQAKLALIHDVSARVTTNGAFFTHPFAWAPFVLFGDGFSSTPTS